MRALLSLTFLTCLSLLMVTSSSRTSAASPDTQCYEMRIYYAAPGKLDDLNARFRNHTIKLFEKHGMQNVVYFTPIDKDGKPVENKLVYLLAHQSSEARTASFAAFGKDPEWVAAREASEKDGKIVAKVESQLFVPTDYSPMK